MARPRPTDTVTGNQAGREMIPNPAIVQDDPGEVDTERAEAQAVIEAGFEAIPAKVIAFAAIEEAAS